MYAVFSTVYTRNQDASCSKQSQVVVEYFGSYLDAVTSLGDERVVYVFPHEVEVLTVEKVD